MLDADTEQLMSHPESEQLVTDLNARGRAGGTGDGWASFEPDFIEQMLDYTRKMGPYLPSMQIDRRLGRAMEVEAIFGDPVRRALTHDCAVPLIQTLLSPASAA